MHIQTCFPSSKFFFLDTSLVSFFPPILLFFFSSSSLNLSISSSCFFSSCSFFFLSSSLTHKTWTTRGLNEDLIHIWRQTDPSRMYSIRTLSIFSNITCSSCSNCAAYLLPLDHLRYPILSTKCTGKAQKDHIAFIWMNLMKKLIYIYN